MRSHTVSEPSGATHLAKLSTAHSAGTKLCSAAHRTSAKLSATHIASPELGAHRSKLCSPLRWVHEVCADGLRTRPCISSLLFLLLLHRRQLLLLFQLLHHKRLLHAGALFVVVVAIVVLKLVWVNFLPAHVCCSGELALCAVLAATKRHLASEHLCLV